MKNILFVILWVVIGLLLAFGFFWYGNKFAFSGICILVSIQIINSYSNLKSNV